MCTDCIGTTLLPDRISMQVLIIAKAMLRASSLARMAFASRFPACRKDAPSMPSRFNDGSGFLLDPATAADHERSH
ncbi:hypothetical protein V473_00745 [Sphingobium cupriresistens LL01]|uniref:Uncharacterized protein n=1 Tax=Sphingobium cupriresistens LL01 TaxID=1420583 RepID=A0A0J7Y4R4_9SPHN|nr:hypothetical protein V473_00745 [Sphingobium cupriresistens LL01]